ncbi:hypothetical protein VPH49_18040 [Pseudomonas luteola]|uniref:hypothetical protein n=1 Tax=Pseudomonas luteola TaxID=47886 RepID=UPI003A87E774
MDSTRLAINGLLFPRSIAIGPPEFATQSEREYFQLCKEKMTECSFEQDLEEIPLHKQSAEKMLVGLKVLPIPADNGNTLSWDDILIYPTLRNLTVVKGLAMPSHVSHYVESVAALTGAYTYYDSAL